MPYKNKEEQLQQHRDYYYKNRDRIRKNQKEYRKEHREKMNKQTREWHRKFKMIVLTHYGGDPPKCACPGCNEAHIEFLTIDHIYGGGNKHRKKVGYGHDFNKWLIDNNFPEGFQVLCMNCNWAKRSRGGCPHQKEGLNTSNDISTVSTKELLQI